jgi:hypothetical protein
MTNDEINLNDKSETLRKITPQADGAMSLSDFGLGHFFVIRHSAFVISPRSSSPTPTRPPFFIVLCR